MDADYSRGIERVSYRRTDDRKGRIMLKKFLRKQMDHHFEKLADRIAEDITKAIVLSSLTEQDKQNVIDKYSKIFMDKFNEYMSDFSKMEEAELAKLLTMEVGYRKDMFR